MKQKRKVWIIANLSRGIFDGFYFQGPMYESVSDVLPILTHWRNAQPDDNIILTEVVSEGGALIPDDRFMPDFVPREDGGRA